MAIRIPWDKYEVALLLEYCIKIENRELTRVEAISIVSQILRSRATRNGKKIDDIFRNENEIGMQLSSMRNCYLGKKQGLTISKLFYDIVALQKDDPNAFHQILEEESEKMETSTWQEFLLWLGNKHPDKNKETKRALLLVNVLGRKNHIMKKTLSDISDPEEIEGLTKLVTNSSSLGFQSRKNASAAYNALRLYAEYLRKKISSVSDEIKLENVIVDSEKKSNDEELGTVDFHVIQSYAHTKPVLKFLVENNPIVPIGREKIILQAIYQGLKGNVYLALHVLAPQLENIFRNIAENVGGIVITLENDGTSQKKTLSSIFELPELCECYDNDILFVFRGLLNEKTGSNIRNEIAHGIMNETVGNSGTSIFLLCAAIKLLSYTSKRSLEIYHCLSEKEKTMVSHE